MVIRIAIHAVHTHRYYSTLMLIAGFVKSPSHQATGSKDPEKENVQVFGSLPARRRVQRLSEAVEYTEKFKALCTFVCKQESVKVKIQALA